jgi:hypothetical protein
MAKGKFMCKRDEVPLKRSRELTHMDFQDAIHLERIARALWAQRSRGRASVMIGSGMSLNARPKSGLRGQKGFPTWRALAEAFVAGLYPDRAAEPDRKSVLERAVSTSGALRLAEEYEAAHGRAALDQLLISAIPDGEFDPGPLHRLLLQLPWSDVFTTNYDTLLERAARSIVQIRYDVVTSASEVTHAQRPRIVKLHGSFPSGPFTITEENFRTYPVQFAAFVNLARQAFVENTFCLIGFSGDDPNFLQWSGWARDTLGSSVSQIYLTGLLDLTGAQRKLLQDRHVMPIDLAPLFPVAAWSDPKTRYAAAMEWLLLSLEGARPPDMFDWPFQSPSPKTQPITEGLPPLPDFGSDRRFEPEAASPQFMARPR